MQPTIETLELDFGTAILTELCGQPLMRNQQPVRLFDQTKHSAEFYFHGDKNGKPYIQDFQNGRRLYPVTAFAQAHDLDFNAAKEHLLQRYYGEGATDLVRVAKEPLLAPAIDYLPLEQYQACQCHFERNGLYIYLLALFGPIKAAEVFLRYRLGTSRHWQFNGYLSTCLPQFDIAGNLRQVKIMPFDSVTGRRAKKHQQAEWWNPKTERYESTKPDTDKTYFAGRQQAKAAGIKDAYLKQCFFGEHLLTEYPDQSVGIVEGETTAIVCSIIWPQFIWLATGGSSGAGWTSAETFGVLAGRNVTLWPDSGKYIDWSQKAEVLRPLVQSLYVTDYVEKHAPNGTTNVDLRDLLTDTGNLNSEDYNSERIDAFPEKPQRIPPTARIDFPKAPLAFDAFQQLEAFRWLWVPADMDEAEYDQMLLRNYQQSIQTEVLADSIS